MKRESLCCSNNDGHATSNVNEICVVHLVWVPLGAEPLKAFLSSYSSHRAGMDHDLVVLFNGFTSQSELEKYHSLLSRYQHSSLLIRKVGLDIESYFIAVKKTNYKYYCFLNSYSRISADDWLLKLYSHVINPDVGLVGATGSWESMYSNYLKEYGITRDASLYRQVRAHVRHNFNPCKLKCYFDQFPNYHIRTNGFMLSREIMLKIRHRPIRNKMDTYRFESGKGNMTKQILNMDLKALIVGKNGKGYDKEEWYMSDTFKWGNQDNLLITDNQTESYRTADPSLRMEMSRNAWGDKAYVSPQ